MQELIQRNEALVESFVNMGILRTPRIIKAFLSCPRHLFVPDKYLKHAYEDIPLPTFNGQTISQPYTMAVMLEALNPSSGDKVLDIGSGTGWTTCLLAEIVGKKGLVVGIELNPKLAEFSKENIRKTQLKNIEIICGDGKKGYPKEAPYNCVLINAACNNVPEMVVEQVKIGGKIVAPINSIPFQEMVLFHKLSSGELTRINLGNYVFVPLK